MDSIAAIVSLGLAFLVLVVTFRWIARILARRLERVGAPSVARSEDGEPPPEGVAAEEEPRGAGTIPGTIHGANYSLVLGILAILLFVVSPLFLLISAAGAYYGGRVLYQGIRFFQVVIYRALAGTVLSLGSVGVQYLWLTDQFADLIGFIVNV